MNTLKICWNKIIKFMQQPVNPETWYDTPEWVQAIPVFCVLGTIIALMYFAWFY